MLLVGIEDTRVILVYKIWRLFNVANGENWIFGRDLILRMIDSAKFEI